MGETLKVIRDLTIVLAIYLYFIAWVYVHFYYQQFGISTNAIRIDYNSYLMYSYNVLTSPEFMKELKTLLWAVLIVVGCILLLKWLILKFVRAVEGKTGATSDTAVVTAEKFNKQYRILLLAILAVIIFPQLFKVSREVAINNYRQDRKDTRNLKTVQFIFRKDADLLSPAIVLDSSLSPANNLYADIKIIKDDTDQILRLLGESDTYYIVLQQRPFNPGKHALPTGFVYFINKKDVLLSKIILRSL